MHGPLNVKNPTLLGGGQRAWRETAVQKYVEKLLFDRE
jgi:hypothetical protein